jgi:hypothetical protein
MKYFVIAILPLFLTSCVVIVRPPSAPTQQEELYLFMVSHGIQPIYETNYTNASK